MNRCGYSLLTLILTLVTTGCDDKRSLTLVPALPSTCGSAQANELRLRGLGDFQPTASDETSLSLAAPDATLSLELPRATRVLTIEGVGTATTLIGRTAPSLLPSLWAAPAHTTSVAYGPPDTFCATAPLSYARTGHRATLLSDGSVLLSGGVDSEGHAVVPLERYLPSGDDTSAVARFALADPGGPTIDDGSVLGHAASRLADGRVLLSGGSAAQQGSTSAIAYQGAVVLDAEGRVSQTLLLSGVGRAYHASVVLADGTLLLTGGCSEVTSGVCVPGRTLDSAVIFDPQKATFTAAPSLTIARAGHVALLRSDGLVLLVGGLGDDGSALAPELYDPAEARGTTLTGPVGHAVRLDSGLVVALDDSAGPSSRALTWSGLDDAPVPLPQLPSDRDDGTITALEDGSVLFAGGWDGTVLADTSLVLGGEAQTPALAITGFAAHGHTATRLLDGSVLLAGGADATGAASVQASVYLRSLVGPFDTPATLDFSAASAIAPSRTDHVSLTDGTLEVTTGAATSGALVDFALVEGPDVAGASGTGFQLSLLAGRSGDSSAALVFGAPGTGSYVAVIVAVGAAPSVLVVAPGRPGLLSVTMQSGCDAVSVADAELPDGSLAPLTLTARSGVVELHSATRRLLRCSGSAWPARGTLGVGARSGTVRFDNVQLTR